MDLVQGRPPPMSFASSDMFFLTQMAFENSTRNQDMLGLLDMVSKNFLIDTDSYQNMLELSFRVKKESSIGAWPKFPKSLKKIPIAEAADWPKDDAHLKPHGVEAHDRLGCIRALCAQEWTSRKMKRWTASSQFYDEDSSVRDLRKASALGVK